MSVALISAAICLQQENYMGAFISICTFTVGYQNGQGAMGWLYVPEVCVDAAVGFASSAAPISSILVASTFESMINSGIGVTGTLYYYAFINVLAVIFFICVVKETLGFTDIEKKNIYAPKSQVVPENEVDVVPGGK